MKTLILHGQEVVFPNKTEWKRVFDKQYTNVEIPEFFVKIIKSHLNHITLNSKFRIGLGKYNSEKFNMPYSFVEFKDSMWRVRMDITNCKFCKMKLLIGNPFDPLIYVGIGEEFDRISLMKQASSLTKDSCPHCSNKLLKEYLCVSIIE
jgi:hypothetical protein